MTPEQLREMTGQDNYKGTSRLILNEILINGDGDIEEIDGKIVHKGGYYRKRIWVDKPEDSKPEDINLGKEVAVVFLKIRRKLVQRSTDGQIIRSSNEHNTANDTVSIYEAGQKVYTGSAREARTRYEGLRTVQVIYALLLTDTKEPELVRVTVKGASLGSQSRPKELPDFYQYISSFDEPVAYYKTLLGVHLEQGKKKYYAMTFTKGDMVREDNLTVVYEALKKVHEHTKTEVVETVPVASDADGYPEEEVDPASIHF